MSLTPEIIEQHVQTCLEAFYMRRIAKLSKLKLKDALKRKNPYLFRAIGTESATEIISQILTAYMSSSDEGIFGDAFFEPLARLVSGSASAGGEGADIIRETDSVYTAIAVKSGPSVFNAQSRRRQNQEFLNLRSRMFKLQKQFDAIVGYCYGKKKTSVKASDKIFRELAGQVFWEELTGDPVFYLKIITAMKTKPLEHKLLFQEEWNKAVNRFTRDFTNDYCVPDGAIDWGKLLTFNSGR
ncbi:MAG: PmeII family type II restriction endonuclease [bacterium]